MPQPSNNKVFLNPEGYLEVTVVGHQTGESFQKIYDDALPFISKLQKENKPLLGYIDMTNETGYSLNSDKVAMELLEKLNYDRIAMCNPPHAEVSKGIILAIGKSHNTKVFDNRQEAISWLLDE